MKTEELFEAIEQQTGLTREQVTSKCRNEELVFARRIICYYLNMHNATQRTIASTLNIDRATVSYNLCHHESEYKYNPKYRAMFDIAANCLEKPCC